MLNGSFVIEIKYNGHVVPTIVNNFSTVSHNVSAIDIYYKGHCIVLSTMHHCKSIIAHVFRIDHIWSTMDYFVSTL